VAAFCDSRKALAAFQASPQSFDLVITDQTMPHLTGSELTSAVHGIRPGLPVIICTGYDRNAMNAKTGLYIIKPVDFRALSEMIRKALVARPEGIIPEKSRIEQISAPSV
jgi:two-component system, cell cycle sensor histidine kinase and response regulator CckA